MSEPLAQDMASLTDETWASLELFERRSKERIEQSWTRLELAGQSMEFSPTCE